MLIKRIDRYIFSEVIGPLLGGIVFFSFIFLMFQALRLAEFFILHGIPGATLTKMTLLMVLSFMPAALPVAFLIAVLVAFGRLSSDNELTALKSNGISVFRLSVPITALAAIVVIISLGLNMKWVPWGDHLFQSTLYKVSNTKVTSSIKAGTFTSGFFDLLIYADQVNPKKGLLRRVFLFDEREPKNPVTVIAQEGEILPVKSPTELGAAAMLKLQHGNIHRNDLTAQTYQKIDFGEYRLYLKIDEGMDNSVIKPRMIPYELLKKKIQELDSHDPFSRELRTEFWRRYAIAFSPFIFVFLGIGYGTIKTRSIRASAALVAFIVLTLYWTLQAYGTVAAQKGYIPPFLAMQLPNIVLSLAAIRGYRSARW